MKRNTKCQLEVDENRDIILFPVTVHQLLILVLGPRLRKPPLQSQCSLLARVGFLPAFPILQAMPGLDHGDKLHIASSQLVE